MGGIAGKFSLKHRDFVGDYFVFPLIGFYHSFNPNLVSGMEVDIAVRKENDGSTHCL